MTGRQGKIGGGKLPPERLRYLAGRIHALGPRALSEHSAAPEWRAALPAP